MSLQVYPFSELSEGLLALFTGYFVGGDFSAIYAEGGFVKAAVDLGAGFTTSSLPLPSNQFSSITVNRVGRHVTLTVTEGGTVSTITPGVFDQLNVGDTFYIGGGLPSVVQRSLPSQIAQLGGFTGCIGGVTINEQPMSVLELKVLHAVEACEIDFCDQDTCRNGGSCLQDGQIAVCSCPPLFTGPRCDMVIEIPMFNNDLMTSFVVFPSDSEVSIGHTTTIAMHIKPMEDEGLIFYAALRTVAPFYDFVSIGLRDGYVEFRYNLGSGTAIIKSTGRMGQNKWHSIFAQRVLRDGKTY